MAAFTAIVVLLLLIASPAPADGDLLGSRCGVPAAKHLYSPNSAYQANVLRLAAVLPEHASSSSNLFATATLGIIPDAVYGLALCRGDISSAICKICVATALKDALELCPFDKDASMYYDSCHIRFSSQDFINSTDFLTPDTFVVVYYSAPENGSSPANPFDAAVDYLINETSNYAAAAPNHFATAAFSSVTSGQSIYALAQCTPDMALADCSSCLRVNFEYGRVYLRGWLRGGVIAVRCNCGYAIHPFFNGSPRIQVPELPSRITALAPEPAAVPPSNKKGKNKTTVVILATVIPSMVVLGILVVFLLRLIKHRRKGKVSAQSAPTEERVPKHDPLQDQGNTELVMYNYVDILNATRNFSNENKLGQGSFGPVYKGQLPSGKEIAVKCLSSSSEQGEEEFMSELQLIAKLQHVNLVTLLGWCIQESSNMIIYEFMERGSFDQCIFDSVNGEVLNWEKRMQIIEGTAQGLLYLHKHSRLKIIHRDVKPSNILLDKNFNPKISDFGLAKVFRPDATEDTTIRARGTYGYMAPEYSAHGVFSEKTDVFSFGILVLETISAKRSSWFFNNHSDMHIAVHVYKQWKNEKWTDMVDARLSPDLEVRKLMHVALLCVQENYLLRPSMSEVIRMIHSSEEMPEPRKRGTFFLEVGIY